MTGFSYISIVPKPIALLKTIWIKLKLLFVRSSSDDTHN